MSRWRNIASGAVVSVDNSKDDRFDAAWERLDEERTSVPVRRTTKKSDNK